VHNLLGFVVLSGARHCACVKQHTSSSHCFSLRYLIFYMHTFHVGGHIPWPGSRPDFTRISVCGIFLCLSRMFDGITKPKIRCFGSKLCDLVSVEQLSVVGPISIPRTTNKNGALVIIGRENGALVIIGRENGALVIIGRENGALVIIGRETYPGRPTLCPSQSPQECNGIKPEHLRRESVLPAT